MIPGFVWPVLILLLVGTVCLVLIVRRAPEAPKGMR